MLIDKPVNFALFCVCKSQSQSHRMPCLNGKIHPSMIGEIPWETSRGVQIYGGNGGMGEQRNIYKERAAAFFSISILPKIVWAMWSCSMSVLVNFKLSFPFLFLLQLSNSELTNVIFCQEQEALFRKLHKQK